MKKKKKNKKPRPKKISEVYIMQDTMTTNIKIGVTTKLYIRKWNLSAGNHKLVVLKRFPGKGYDFEQSLHQRFEDYRIKGEWYRFEGELKAYIEGS